MKNLYITVSLQLNMPCKFIYIETKCVKTLIFGLIQSSEYILVSFLSGNSSVGRAGDCSCNADISRSVVQIRLAGIFFDQNLAKWNIF